MTLPENSLNVSLIEIGIISDFIQYFGDRKFVISDNYVCKEINEIESEIYRYAVLPGQALSYYLGYLKILEMRKNWCEGTGAGEQALKEFHDAFIKCSYLPIHLIEKQLRKF